MKAKIVSTGSYIPERNVTTVQLYQKIANFDIDQARDSFIKKGMDVEKASSEEIFDIWVKRVCGISSRPFVDEELSKKAINKTEVETMGLLASEKAIQNADLNKDDIQHVIFSTYSTNRIMPSAACSLVKLLGLKNASAITINGACSGFLDGLIDAVIKIEAGVFDTVLVVAAEQLSNKMDYDDPKTAIIFSDGAGAFVVRKSTTDEVKGFSSGVDYSEQVYMERKGPIFFNSGPLVERNAVRTMQKISISALEKANLTLSDIDFIVPHQANIRIIDSFEAAIKKQIEKDGGGSVPHIVKCIETYGNLSSATVPVALDLFVNKKLGDSTYRKGHTFLFCSVGGGYTYSALITKY